MSSSEGHQSDQFLTDNSFSQPLCQIVSLAIPTPSMTPSEVSNEEYQSSVKGTTDSITSFEETADSLTKTESLGYDETIEVSSVTDHEEGSSKIAVAVSSPQVHMANRQSGPQVTEVSSSSEMAEPPLVTQSSR